MKNVTKRIFAILSAVFMMFGIISESTLSVSAASVTLSTTVSTLDGKTGQTFNLVDPGNITISNWKRSTNQVVYNGGNKQSPNWTWSQLSSAGSGSNWETDLTKVWDGSRSSTHNFSGYLTNGTVTALGSNLYDSATWLHKGTNETQSTINRFQGEFNIGSLDPNNYAFTISTVTGDNIYINDNIFVFVYPKGTTITNDNYRNYFAFWTGTVTKFVSNASYLGYSATNLLGTTGDTYTGLNNITDGWHLTSAQDNVGDIILKAYNENGTKDFVIDVFTEDFIQAGAMYRPVLTATAVTRYPFQFTKVDVESGYGLAGAEFTLYGSGNNTKYTATSDANGVVKMNVPAGTYTLKEEKAPDNYTASGNTWTVVIKSDGTYTISGTPGLSGSYSAGYKITNEPQKQNLTVTKNVVGTTAQKNTTFTFNLKVTYADGTTPYTSAISGATKVSNGNYTFTLTDGQSKTFSLPKVCKYEVTEVTGNNYVTSVSGTQSGDMSAARSVTFTNTFKMTKLVITKDVTGTTRTIDKQFQFNIVLKNQDGSALTGLNITGLTETATAGTYTFTLADDGTMTLYPLPYGCQYTITETNYSSEGYTTYVTDTSKTESYTATGTLTDNLSTYISDTNGVISAIKTIAYENEAHEYDVTVEKQVTGNMADLSKEFIFKATLTLNGEAIDFTTPSTNDYSVNGNVATFTLKDNEAITLEDIPHGATLQLTETNADGYTTTITVGDSKYEAGDSILINTDGVEIEVTNHKDALVDTGIDLGSPIIPIVLLGIIITCLVAIMAIRFKRRKMY